MCINFQNAWPELGSHFLEIVTIDNMEDTVVI